MAGISITFAQPRAFWLLLILPVIALVWFIVGRRGQRLSRTAVLLRLLVFALLAVTLAQPLLATGGNAATTIFVVDRSKSLTASTSGAATDWVNAALHDAGSNDRAAVITFGANPTVAESVTKANDIGDGWTNQQLSATDQDFTDIESSLALARALPAGGSRRIVLLSDGAENVGAAMNQVAEAAADHTPVDVVPLTGVSDRDLRLDGLDAPSSVWQGETVNLLATIAGGAGGSGTLDLVVDGAVKSSQQITFPAGLSSYPFALSDLTPGFHAIAVRVSSNDNSLDPYPENDVFPAAVVVRDKPQLLLVAPNGSDPGTLRNGLQQGGAAVTVTAPERLPSRLSELGTYDAIVLDNVPANALTVDQLAGLQEATRTLGRGLIVVGGTSSYGPGNYAGTTLEQTLPVTVKVTNSQQRPKVALLMIIDKSGSMSYDPTNEGTSKIDMAKKAAELAAESLQPGDEFGVLVFDEDQSWAVPMTTINGQSDLTKIDQSISQIQADGGTEIYPALSVGLDAIRNTDAQVKHVILMSDGNSRTGTKSSYMKLLKDASTDHTTVSTIAIGSDADTDLMSYLADNGGGKYYYTDKPSDIPKFTLAESKGLGSEAIIRGQFQAIQTSPSQILQGFKPQDLPALEGYDYAQAKPDAQVVLTSDRGDPVLSAWQYGLGRVVAWTADDGADLAAPWANWQQYSKFWSGMVRWALPDPDNRPIQVNVTRQGTDATITVTATAPQGGLVDLATTTATITTPSGGVLKDLSLYQSGPGQYQRQISAPASGAYKIEVHQQRGNQPLDELDGFAIPPSPELEPATGADTLLKAIAGRTGGRVLSLEDPSKAFSDNGLQGSPLRNYTPLWYVPLALALALFLVEVGLRLRFFSFRRRT